MPRKIAVMLDGGHLRVYASRANKPFDPTYIEKIAHACALANVEEVHRIMYYDCAPFTGTVQQPVSGNKRTFQGNDQWLHELAQKDLLAVRRGTLKFRGFVLKNIPYQPTGSLQDADFEPKFEQKGVDMRIGIDMPNLTQPVC